MATTIYLARHGEYQNDHQIIPFRLPGFPLNQLGQKQSLSIADQLKDKNIIAIYSSPVLRCYQTAKLIAQSLNLKPKKSSLITETKTPFEGMSLAKFQAKKQETFWHPFHLNHGGETIQAVFDRSYRLLKKTLNQHQDKNILMVSHAHALMALIYGLVEKDLSQYLNHTQKYISKGGLAKFEFKHQRLKLFKTLNY